MNRSSRATIFCDKKKTASSFHSFRRHSALSFSGRRKNIDGRCSTVPRRLLKLMNQCQPRTGCKRTPWRRSGDRLRPISLRPSALCVHRWRFRSPAATLVFRRRWSLDDGDGLSLPHGWRHGHLPGQCWQQSLPPWRVMAAETLVAMVMDFLHEHCSTLLPSAGSPCTARRTCCLPHGRGPTGPAPALFSLRQLFVVLSGETRSRLSPAIHYHFYCVSAILPHNNWHYIALPDRKLIVSIQIPLGCGKTRDLVEHLRRSDW